MTDLIPAGWLTREQAQALTGYSKDHLTRLAGGGLVTAHKLAGHAQVTTTARYDRRGDRAKLAAVDLLSVPYTRRRLEV
jgi:hypothetical protein